MSRRILLATFGTLGDVYPFVAIARALAARGLEPLIAAPAMHRRTIEGEGIAYAPIRPDMQDICEALGTDLPGAYRIMLGNPHFILDEIYMRFLRETYEDVVGAARGCAAILTHSLLVGANLAAETLGLPAARVALAPLHLQSAVAPSATPLAPYYLTPCLAPVVGYNRLVRRIVRGSVALRMGRLRAFRRSLGLPPTREDCSWTSAAPTAPTASSGCGRRALRRRSRTSRKTSRSSASRSSCRRMPNGARSIRE